jgi:UDP-2,3-diacylglucosamine pyrophosphatase LpxH
MTHLRRHTVVVSDVHLSQAHPHDESDPLWMRYRRSDYHPDADFEAFVTRLLDRCGDEPVELVFNGDVFDFDAPVVANGTSVFDEYPLDDAGCSAQIQRILDDHAGFVRAAARVVVASGGHRLLFVSGNHDVELYWPGVRHAIREAVRKAATALSPEAELSDLEERVRFRTWFHVTEDRIYLEHGSQYDMLNGVPDPMVPLAKDAARIHPVCGKLAFKRTGARMGYFNPYCEDTFYMGGLGYIRHFLTEYLFSRRRHIVRTWVGGSLVTVLEILRNRRNVPELPEGSMKRAVEETNASRSAILRELWLDRVFLATILVVAGGASFMFGSITAGCIALAAVGAAFVVYEVLTPKPDIRTYDSAPPSVAKIFEIHGVRAMCMGHTHRPYGSWEAEGFRGNSGAWCPAFTDRECTKPVLDGRPFLWLTGNGKALWGGLHWFRDGRIAPDPIGVKSAPVEDAPEPVGLIIGVAE